MYKEEGTTICPAPITPNFFTSAAPMAVELLNVLIAAEGAVRTTPLFNAVRNIVKCENGKQCTLNNF
jgi:hypothetical protein